MGEFSGYWYSGSGSLWHWWLSCISSSVPLTCSVQPSGYLVEKLRVSVDWDNQLSRYGSKLFAIVIKAEACVDPEGGGGGTWAPDPLKNHKNIGFPSNIGPDPL